MHGGQFSAVVAFSMFTFAKDRLASLDVSLETNQLAMLINPDKTTLLYVGVPQLIRALPRTLPSATVLGTEIKPVTVLQRTWECTSIVIIILMSISLKLHLTVNRIKHFLDQSTLIYLINTFVFGKLFYCSTVWSNTSNENIRKLQFVQNSLLRRRGRLRASPKSVCEGLRLYDRNWLKKVRSYFRGP